MQTITFSEFSLGTIDPIFTFSNNRVVFDGVIVPDGAQPRTPTIAANTSYFGPVFFEFDNPVESVSLDVGFFNNIGSTRIEFLDSSGRLLYQETNTTFGVDTFSFSSSAGIAEVRVIDIAFDAAGFSVDTVVFGDVIIGPNAPPITLASTATSFEFNSGTLTDGTISAFSDTLSNSDRTDSFRVDAPVAGTLAVTSILPSVSGSAETYTFEIDAGAHIIGIGDLAVDPGNIFYTVNWSFEANETFDEEALRELSEDLAAEVKKVELTSEISAAAFETIEKIALSAGSASDATNVLGSVGKAFGAAGIGLNIGGRTTEVLGAGDDWQCELYAQITDMVYQTASKLAGATAGGLIGLKVFGVGILVGVPVGGLGGSLLYDFTVSEGVKASARTNWEESFGLSPEPLFVSLNSIETFDLAAQRTLDAQEEPEPIYARLLDIEFYFNQYADARSMVESGEVQSALEHYYKFGIANGYKPNAIDPPLQEKEIAFDLEEYRNSTPINTSIRDLPLGDLAGDKVSSLELSLAAELNSQRTDLTEFSINAELSSLANRIAKDWVLNNTEAYVVEAQLNSPSGWALTPPNGQVVGVPAGLSVLAAFSSEQDVTDILASLTRGVEAADVSFGLASQSLGVAEFGGLWVLVVSTERMPNDVVVSDDAPLLKTNGTEGSDIVAAGSAVADVDLGKGSDSFIGGAFDDHVKGGGDDDQLKGGVGTDTAKYDGKRSDYLLKTNEDGSISVSDIRSGTPDGIDKLTEFEFLEFSDELVAVSSILNAPPVALDDTFSVEEDQTLTGNVLDDNGNGADSDLDGDQLTVSVISGPTEGILSLNDDGSFSYEADADFFDLAAPGDVIEQTFTYQIDDGNGAVDQATATISVNILNDGEMISANNGKDDVIGTDGGEDTLEGGNGKDRIFGLDGADHLFGGNGKDFLDGGEGPDKLHGGNGKDILIGGIGDDELNGGKGNDTFVFALGEGVDTVLDYEIGKDLIELDGLTFGDLSIGQAGDDATISANGELLAVLTGVAAASLSESDFFSFV